MLLLGSALVPVMHPASPAAAQEVAAESFAIAPQALSSALVEFSKVTGMQVIVNTNLVRGVASPGVSGERSRSAAMATLLSGTDLEFRLRGNTVIVEGRGVPGAASDTAPEDGSVMLGTIVISGGVPGIWDGSGASVYDTAASVSHISGETISAFRGTSPSDILASDVTVLSGEARTSGALNVNIRGMQGMGRTPVLVDGTLNQNTVYRGYQGLSDRTYIDPDFIGGVSITRGASIGPGAAGATGGKVEMTTIGVNDIILPGRKVGVQLKFGMVGNNSKVVPGAAGRTIAYGDAGYSYSYEPEHRPDLLDLGGKSASVVLAARSENFDILLGYAWRDRGNYHVGENGDGARTAVVCDGSSLAVYYFCQQSYPYMYGLGDAAVAAGDAVLNTSEKTNSGLLKATWRFGDGHSLEFFASEYRSHFGENYPSDTTSYWTRYSSMPQRLLSFSQLRRGALTWRWQPESDLIDLRAAVWATRLLDQAQATSGSLGDMKFTNMNGVDITNTSRLTLLELPLTLQYGLSYRKEKTGPEAGYWAVATGRQGERSEIGAFLRGTLDLNESISLNFGLGQQNVSILDGWNAVAPTETDYDTASYSFGIVYQPRNDIEFYANYTDAGRLPSLIEGTRGIAYTDGDPLKAERSKSFEIGTNITRDGLFLADDSLRLKLAYFNTDVDSYISRRWVNNTNMVMLNIHSARFEGVELGGSYELGGFKADLSANYYIDMEFCLTAATCRKESLGADFATNQIPPKYSVGLTLTKSFLEDRLSFSARFTHFDERTIPAGATGGGAQPFIEAVPWREQTIVDIYGRYDINERVAFNFGVDNLTDRYYIAPLSLGPVPSPGRTLRLGLSAKF